MSWTKNDKRAITVTEIAPGPYFSIINVHLVDINVLCLQNLMKFQKEIKGKTKMSLIKTYKGQ